MHSTGAGLHGAIGSFVFKLYAHGHVPRLWGDRFRVSVQGTDAQGEAPKAKSVFLTSVTIIAIIAIITIITIVTNTTFSTWGKFCSTLHSIRTDTFQYLQRSSAVQDFLQPP